VPNSAATPASTASTRSATAPIRRNQPRTVDAAAQPSPRPGDAPTLRPWPATPPRSRSPRPPDAAAHSPVAAHECAHSRCTPPCAAAAHPHRARRAAGPNPTAPTGPHTPAPGTPAHRRAAPSRPPSRPRLPSSPVHSDAPRRPFRVGQDRREGRRLPTGCPHPGVAHDRRQGPTPTPPTRPP
jgi:hypothetical protein